MTVTFKNKGRLGNFLFQAATTIAYALDHGIDFAFPNKTNDQKWNPIYFDHLMKEVPMHSSVTLNEKEYFKYDPIAFDKNWGVETIVLDGYFQNPMYFEHRRDEILDYFHLEDCNYSPGIVSVHVRRGDYLQLTDKHVLPSVAWYKEAMSLFPKCKFVFHSDDIQWCKDNFNHKHYFFHSDEMWDLRRMMLSEHNICSPSTFAWWGAWLNQNPDKKVIVPKQWMQPGHSNQWTEEIIPKSWIRL
mgnify:CR=1 FL=1